jgi:hypothetical protein
MDRKISFRDIQALLFSGGNVIVNAADYSTSELKSIAFTARANTVSVVIRNAKRIPVIDCKSIAFSGGKGTVIFDFTE